MPADVLSVTGGQDHGARFGLRGPETTIGRGPVMDIVLTDPRVSRRHAVIRLSDTVLTIEDLASSAGTTVNGSPISGTTTLAPGDQVEIGSTELTVLWTPSGSFRPEPGPERAPPVTAVAAAPRPAPEPAAAVPAEEVAAPITARPEVLLPIACLALSAFCLLCVWMPVLGDRSGTDSVWSLDPQGFRIQAVLAALIAGLAAGGWLQAVSQPHLSAMRLPLAAATAIAGGLVAGLPLFLAAVDVPGASRELGLAIFVIAGLVLVGCAVAGVATIATEHREAPVSAGAVLLVAAGGGVGGLLVTIASPLTWISSGLSEYSGFDDNVGAGGWLVVLALAVVAASVLALAVARAGDRRAALYFATCAAALAAASFTFATGAAFAFSSFQMEVGLSLVLTGSAIALTSTAIGTAALSLGPTGPAEAESP